MINQPCTTKRLNAELDKRHWPLREYSLAVQCGAVCWHVQQSIHDNSQKPAIVLVHGTGASTHSMRHLFSHFKTHHTTLAFDLPGHGLSTPLGDDRLSLPFMAEQMLILLDALEGFDGPLIGIGHSAGVAILMDAARRAPQLFERIIGLNAALKPMAAHAVVSPLARALFLNPFVPQYFAWRASWGGAAKGMLDATGTILPEDDLAFYKTLFQDPDHVRGALGMMAAWDLEPLQKALPTLQTRVDFLTARDDKYVAPNVSEQASIRAPNATWRDLGTGGHLIHEVASDHVIAAIKQISAGSDSTLAQRG